MMLHIPEVLTADELNTCRRLLAEAGWIDGRETAGAQAAQVKRNFQLPENGDITQQLQQIVLGALNRHPLFFSAALPKKILPPYFNCYTGEMNTFGNHVDNAIRTAANGQFRVRADVSCTLFFSHPHEYDGGELVVEDTFGEKRVKLPAGDMILYPSSSVHRVEPVTKGARTASFFWTQSMIREDERRRLLYDLDLNIMALREQYNETAEIVNLTSTYHNLLRMWAET
ncbi:Fe2+-dependent dioxygenase [Thiomicrorhabdus cannonii]|uniref:Fe2+-dependent dioxygenase n=1 Tax=Thiomicrorhabdus cannonii TaxID=2748011 RepID=UPI0015BFCE81|nr:Fe2+-dependent dioxygenase [Thiomicrorhabdus cannonii]